MARVLLIEDDDLVCSAVTRWLVSKGHEVIGLRTKAEGIDYLRQEAAQEVPALDIVILDLELGGNGRFSGLAILQHIPPRIQRVVLSGFTPDQVRAYVDPLAGVQFFFMKPLSDIEKTQLLHIIEVAGKE